MRERRGLGVLGSAAAGRDGWGLGHRCRIGIGQGEAQRRARTLGRLGTVAEAGLVLGAAAGGLPRLEGGGGLLGTDDAHALVARTLATARLLLLVLGRVLVLARH